MDLEPESPIWHPPALYLCGKGVKTNVGKPSEKTANDHFLTWKDSDNSEMGVTAFYFYQTQLVENFRLRKNISVRSQNRVNRRFVFSCNFLAAMLTANFLVLYQWPWKRKDSSNSSPSGNKSFKTRNQKMGKWYRPFSLFHVALEQYKIWLDKDVYKDMSHPMKY